MTRQGVALINALIVVAALAAVATALLARAERARARLEIRAQAIQAQAYLDAGQAQALAELAQALAARPGSALRPGQGWDRPRDVEIGAGRIAWQVADLQGRFNLNWLGLEGEWGELARPAFARLAAALNLPAGLAERLARAAGPDVVARAAALGTADAPELPLPLPQSIAAAARPADGGAAALAPLWPLVAALPPTSAANVNTMPLTVLQAMIPGLTQRQWAAFDAARAGGRFDEVEALELWIAEAWPEPVQALVELMPLSTGSDWFEIILEARLDSLRLRRAVVVTVAASDDDPDAGTRPRAVLSLPIAE